MRKQNPNHDWFVTLVTCIVGGVLFSIGIAWFIVVIEVSPFATSVNSTVHYKTVDSGYGWVCWESQVDSVLSVVYQAFDADSIAYIELPTQQKPSWSTIASIPSKEEVRSYDLILEQANGWPLPCVVSIVGGSADFLNWQTYLGIKIGSHRSHPGIPRVPPIKPKWLGLFVDTLFYGVIVWFLIRILASIRSVIRAKRGLCRGCGYTMQTLKQCPECGLKKVTSV